MARRDNYIHFRADDELTEMLGVFSEEQRISQSEGCRRLLRIALDDDEMRSATAEAIALTSGAVRRAASIAVNEIAERIPAILEAELAG